MLLCFPKDQLSQLGVIHKSIEVDIKIKSLNLKFHLINAKIQSPGGDSKY